MFNVYKENLILNANHSRNATPGPACVFMLAMDQGKSLIQLILKIPL